MLQIEKYFMASTIEEAYATLQDVPGSIILGGCGYLRLGARKIGTAIDLSRLSLATVVERDGSLEIGSMSTLRKIETDPRVGGLGNAILQKAVENIVGVQLRNCVTLGGSVAGRYPFSDPITALMAMDAELVFHHNGRVRLASYLEGKGLRDILTQIVLPKDERRAAFASLRKTSTDYAVLNVAVAQVGAEFRVVVGSRPGRAMSVDVAQEFLKKEGLTKESAQEAGRLTANALSFGDNPRGTGEYRRAICPVLIQRALSGVMHAA